MALRRCAGASPAGSGAGRRAPEYARGLLSPVERKNGCRWDADLARDDLKDYVVERLGDVGGAPVVDETGSLKKGEKSAGARRQHSGTAGRSENCQVGAFPAYASAKGRAPLDRELRLPRARADDCLRIVAT